MTTSKSNTRWFALTTLAAGLAMIVLDGTIVGIALPTIIADLNLDLSTAQWINALYAVVFAALLMSCGRWGDLVGRRRIFTGGIAVFIAGSVIAALSPNAALLIFARAVQGVGGAMVLPSSLATVNATFRGRDRAIAFGIWGAIMAGVAAIGPLLGAWLTQTWSWPWIFWVNVPIGALVIVAAIAFVDETRSPSESGFDFTGLVLSAAGFGALVFAIIEGPTYGWFSPREDVSVLGLTWKVSNPVSLTAVIGFVALVLIAAFVVTQRRRTKLNQPVIIDLSLLSFPTFRWGNLAAMAVAVGEFALVFILPLYLMSAAGLSIMQAGWALAAMAAGAFVSGGSARFIAQKLGAAKAVLLGLSLEVVAVFATAVVVYQGRSALVVAACLVVYGTGLGIASAQLTSTVLADIPVAQSGQGSATQSTVRQLGSALGTALAGTIVAATLPSAIVNQLERAGAGLGEADRLAEAVTGSVGSLIIQLRSALLGGAPVNPNADPLGVSQLLTHMSEHELVAALETGFGHATAFALVGAGVFLIAGLLGALQIVRISAQRAAGGVSGEGSDSVAPARDASGSKVADNAISDADSSAGDCSRPVELVAAAE
ncbi:MAG: MFS transporter [Actinomycetaceae bacterium]|nr:MFS transporter [Actinomycetaceae bacterium]